MKIAKCLVALHLLLLPASANAGNFYDGNELHERCLDNHILAHMYVIGVVDGMDTFAEVVDLKPPFCLPQNVKARQLSDVTCNYLQEHPEKRQFTAASLVMGAMMKGFPCQ